MPITINGVNIPQIDNFNINSVNNAQIPRWLNSLPEINFDFYNKNLSQIKYECRLDDLAKWGIIKTAVAHNWITLTDTIYGISIDAFIIKSSHSWDISFFNYPWKTSITLLGVC